jgi:beta-lactamase class D
VGYVEKAGAVYYFALQIGAAVYGRAYAQRIPIARAALTQLGVLD